MKVYWYIGQYPSHSCEVDAASGIAGVVENLRFVRWASSWNMKQLGAGSVMASALEASYHR